MLWKKLLLMGRSDLLNMNARELEIKADAMRAQLHARKRCETLKQMHDVLVNICIDKDQLLKDSTNYVIEDEDNIA